jgi:hypothetical protein
VRPQDSVLGGEIFGLQQQFVIHQPVTYASSRANS